MNDFPKYYMVKDKISIPNINLELLYNFLVELYSKTKYDKNDGLKLIWDDKWVHIRSSNTEPIIRIIGEAMTNNKINRLIEEIINTINIFLIEN